MQVHMGFCFYHFFFFSPLIFIPVRCTVILLLSFFLVIKKYLPLCLILRFLFLFLFYFFVFACTYFFFFFLVLSLYSFLKKKIEVFILHTQFLNKKMCYFFVLFNRDIIVNLYLLYFSSSHFSSQSNKRVFHPSTFPFLQPNTHEKKLNIFYPPTFLSSHNFLSFHFSTPPSKW